MPDEKTELDEQVNSETPATEEGGSSDASSEEELLANPGGDSSTQKEEVANQPLSNSEHAQRRIRKREIKIAEQRENVEVANLKAELAQQAQQLRQFATQKDIPSEPPTLEQNGFDQQKHAAAMVSWAQGQLSEPISTDSAAQVVRDEFAKINLQKTSHQLKIDEDAVFAKHYERASKLKVRDYAATEEKALQNIGDDLLDAIQKMVPNSERVLYHLGKNPEKAQGFKNVFDTNPTLATLKIGGLSQELSGIPNTKKAPEPENKVEGGSGGATGTIYEDTPQGRLNKKLAAKFEGATWG